MNEVALFESVCFYLFVFFGHTKALWGGQDLTERTNVFAVISELLLGADGKMGR